MLFGEGDSIRPKPRPPTAGNRAELGRMPWEDRVPALTRLELRLLLHCYSVNSYLSILFQPCQQPVEDPTGRLQETIVVRE